jgi:uncharacterized protein (DUF2384 family)
MAITLLQETRQQTFNRVLGATPEAVESAVLHRELVGEASLEAVLANLADLLGVNKLEALRVLGVSRSRKSRNPKMDVGLLDRAYSALDVYARVASLIGGEHAPQWFKTPKRALDGARPIDLLETRVGLAKLTEMVTALEDGAYL